MIRSSVHRRLEIFGQDAAERRRVPLRTQQNEPLGFPRQVLHRHESQLSCRRIGFDVEWRQEGHAVARHDHVPHHLDRVGLDEVGRPLARLCKDLLEMRCLIRNGDPEEALKKAAELDQRTPFYVGNRELVEKAEEFLRQAEAE